MLEDLPSELFCFICQHLAAEDLLRLSRASKRCHNVTIFQSEEAWRACYLAAGFPPPPASSQSTTPWLKLYKDRYVTSARNRRLDRRVRSIQLHSREQTIRRQLSTLHNEITIERSRWQHALDEIKALKRAQLVHSAKGAWAPTSVQQQWDTITSASPVDIAGRLSSLENDVKVSMTLICGACHQYLRVPDYTCWIHGLLAGNEA
uniref:F-box domain-containing protein n=1 Tax=Dunaliella tertiolecta TaxID=3047 RepID=A0A7S3VHP5_DUNTE